jgi:hypothetical protein
MHPLSCNCLASEKLYRQPELKECGLKGGKYNTGQNDSSVGKKQVIQRYQTCCKSVQYTVV